VITYEHKIYFSEFNNLDIDDNAMSKATQSIELKANMGLVLRGEFDDIKLFLGELETLLQMHQLQLIHRHVSASRLWIKEGDGMNDSTSEIS
jgi:hypothetical protein